MPKLSPSPQNLDVVPLRQGEEAGGGDKLQQFYSLSCIAQEAGGGEEPIASLFAQPGDARHIRCTHAHTHTHTHTHTHPLSRETLGTSGVKQRAAQPV